MKWKHVHFVSLRTQNVCQQWRSKLHRKVNQRTKNNNNNSNQCSAIIVSRTLTYILIIHLLSNDGGTRWRMHVSYVKLAATICILNIFSLRFLLIAYFTIYFSFFSFSSFTFCRTSPFCYFIIFVSIRKLLFHWIRFDEMLKLMSTLTVSFSSVFCFAFSHKMFTLFSPHFFHSTIQSISVQTIYFEIVFRFIIHFDCFSVERRGRERRENENKVKNHIR